MSSPRPSSTRCKGPIPLANREPSPAEPTHREGSPRALRVTLVTETFAPQINGVSRTLGELRRHLIDRGDAVQLIQPDYGDDTRDGTDHHTRAVRLPFYRDLYLPVPPFHRVYQAIDAFRPDLIHVATPALLGLAALRHARRRGVPLVSSFHTNFDQYAACYGIGWTSGAIRRYLRWFHNQTLETCAPSVASRERLERLGFKRLALWPRGVDSSLFRPDRPGRLVIRRAFGWSPDDLVIAHVGRLAREKNTGFLAAALRIVTASRPGVRVLIVGDGPARPRMERRLRSLARFVGHQVGGDLADLYAAGDLFAFASKTETFGNVVLEALASAAPVVALRAGGVSDLVEHGETGLLVEPDSSPEAFAEALIRLVDDERERRRMARAARAFAESQTWSTVMDALRDSYSRVTLSGPAVPGPSKFSNA